jgi:hypothetical protein
MRNIKLWLVVMLVLIVAVSTGCQKQASEEVGAGTFQNSVFRSDFFGMSITIPGGWTVLDKQQMETLKNAGKQMSNSKGKDAMEASEKNTVNLLAAFRHPLGTPVTFNQNFMCLAERVKHVAAVQQGKDYLNQVRKLLTGGAGLNNMTVGNEIYQEKVGGIDFDVMDCDIPINSIVVKQKYYAAIRKGYALCFVLSFVETEEEESLYAILDTVTLK